MQAVEAGCELKLWLLAMFNTEGLNYLSENRLCLRSNGKSGGLPISTFQL